MDVLREIKFLSAGRGLEEQVDGLGESNREILKYHGSHQGYLTQR